MLKLLKSIACFGLMMGIALSAVAPSYADTGLAPTVPSAADTFLGNAVGNEVGISPAQVARIGSHLQGGTTLAGIGAVGTLIGGNGSATGTVRAVANGLGVNTGVGTIGGAILGGGGGDSIADVLCSVVGWFTGSVGKGITTLAIIVLGIGALMGKVSWGMAIITGVGVSVVFGAERIVTGLTGHFPVCGGLIGLFY